MKKTKKKNRKKSEIETCEDIVDHGRMLWLMFVLGDSVGLSE